MFKGQKGLTLVEVLVSMAILSILIILTSSAMMNSLNFSKKATSQVQLQQEANYILAELTNFHETKKKYKVTMDRNPKASKITLIDQNGNTLTISDSRFNYTLTLIVGSVTQLPTEFEVDQSFNNKILHIKLIVEDEMDSRNQFEVKTILSRM
ncbi:PilW family protein [Peribacillus acanthi]|uniref:PilW family protein n=1 Tax=Peribacillus acanthi TaxID=2171554 RepID=UPI000D3E3068|nr:prepilin-type N-terminal cleavage/methylation domain-containing protein [Peribacillus acanthi]